MARKPGVDSFAPEWVACLWLPHFAIRAEQARRPALVGRPLALVGPGDRGATSVVRACSPEALAAGLTAGMPAHEIRSRCPGITVLPFDGRSYHVCYAELLRALDCLSPEIEVAPLEVFYLNLSGLPAAAIEPEQWAQAARESIPPPFSLRVGLASGKFTARVAAHYATAIRPLAVTDEECALFLQDAPSALLPVEPEMARRLELLGLRTLGRIARLPRSALLAQFGRPGERAHRLACGEDHEPLRPYQPPPVIRETQAFPEAAATVSLFHLALERVLRRSCLRPERQGRGIRRIRLEAPLESGEVWEHELTLRRPSERWELIFEELKRRLEPVRPVGALTELTIELTAFAVRLDGQRLLFPDERQCRREQLAYELGQLQARGGSPAVYQIVEVEPWSRLPENQYALLRYDF